MGRGGQVLDSGVLANLARARWLRTLSGFFKNAGREEAFLFPAAARFKFGYGPVGNVQRAEEAPIALAGNQGVARKRFRRKETSRP